MFFLIYKNSRGWHWALRVGGDQTVATSWASYGTKKEVLNFLKLLSTSHRVYDCERNEWVQEREALLEDVLSSAA
jgi:uncharacterized protein YegP (UPF0339 family)